MGNAATLSAKGPLRVALVGSSLRLAGAEKQTVYLARTLLEAGTDLRFFHVGDGGHYESVLRGIGVWFEQIYRPKRPLAMLARLTRDLYRFRPEIVFAPQFGDLLQSGIAGRACNALVLGGLRSDGFYELDSNGWRSAWMLRLAHGLVSNSHRARQNLVSRVPKAPAITILPNVLDLHEFDARSNMRLPTSIPADRIRAVAVGSLLQCKRFDRFLKALALARRKVPALVGVIAGSDCGAGPALVKEASDLGLAPDHVLFLGECGNVPALLTQAGFLVLSSEYEGFPNVILEAMAARLPVITTRVGDAERIVLEGETGYVVDEPEVERIAERMVALAQSPETRTRLGAEGRKRIVREYSYERLQARLLSVFSDFAAHNRRHQLMRRLRGQYPCTGAGIPPARDRQPMVPQHVTRNSFA